MVKAYLLSRGIVTRPPREHEQAYERFRWYVETGVLDKELLRIYDEERVKAQALLEIFRLEKGKRGAFTYKKLPQANKQPAQESIENAVVFCRHLANLCA
jgi:hypothetical protein